MQWRYNYEPMNGCAELTKFKSKTGEKTKETAVRKLMEMVQSGTIDAEVALEQIKKVADMS